MGQGPGCPQKSRHKQSERPKVQIPQSGKSPKASSQRDPEDQSNSRVNSTNISNRGVARKLQIPTKMQQVNAKRKKVLARGPPSMLCGSGMSKGSKGADMKGLLFVAHEVIFLCRPRCSKAAPFVLFTAKAGADAVVDQSVTPSSPSFSTSTSTTMMFRTAFSSHSCSSTICTSNTIVASMARGSLSMVLNDLTVRRTFTNDGDIR